MIESSAPRLDRLIVLGMSAREGDSAPARERASLAAEQLQELLSRWLAELRKQDANAGLVYLGTCHRIEIYAYGVDEKTLLKLWCEEKGIQAREFHVRSGPKAYEHLVRVASSLESEVLGETQITGQVRDAADWSRHRGFLKGPLDRCLQNALKSTKKIRNSTRLSQGVISVAHVAVDGLQDVFDSLEDKRILIVGAGSMALQALERLQRRGVKKITWINRNREKIESHRLASHCEIRNFSELHELIWKHSVSVLATASSLPIVQKDRLKSLKAEKADLPSPRVILDLGLPRNVEEKIHGYGGFYLRNVDEFSNRIEEATEQRKRSLFEAEEILSTEVMDFLDLWQSWGRGPLISQLVQNLETLRKSEIRDLKLENNPEIEYLTRNIYAKLLHRLLEEIECLEEPHSTQVLETLVRAWRRPDRWPEKSPPLLLKLQKDLQLELQQSLQKLR